MKSNLSMEIAALAILSLSANSIAAAPSTNVIPAVPANRAIPATATHATHATPAIPATPATPASRITHEASDTETRIGPFTASYYSDSTFVASEQVDRPSINYIYSNFHDIDSPSFHAIWSGDIEVFGEPELIDINFDLSWSDVSLFIDDAEISSWSNGDRTIQYEFAPGIHSVTIEYHNNWHTTGFDTSFTTNTMYSKDEAMVLIEPYIDLDTQIIYVGCYESADLYNDSTVTLDGTADKVFLFLSSYDSLNWVIQNPHNVTITGIAYSSSSTAATVTADEMIPTIEIGGIAYGYSDFSRPSADITYLTGRLPDHTYGEYALKDAVISIP